MNWKTWTVAGVILIAIFAIYSFASTSNAVDPLPSATRPAAASRPHIVKSAGTPGVPIVHMEWLDAQSGSYKSVRNLFGYVEPPPPPPAPVPKAPLPPPDKDNDGIPDFRDNCPSMYNPDQKDENANGKGDVCDPDYPQWLLDHPKPIPAPVPPQFGMKYIGTFGPASNPIATFNGNGEIVNVRVGETIDGKFVLRSIGIESVEIGYVGFPPDLKTRVPLGQ